MWVELDEGRGGLATSGPGGWPSEFMLDILAAVVVDWGGAFKGNQNPHARVVSGSDTWRAVGQGGCVGGWVVPGRGGRSGG
jgi:hypothetical protein